MNANEPPSTSAIIGRGITAAVVIATWLMVTAGVAGMLVLVGGFASPLLAEHPEAAYTMLVATGAALLCGASLCIPVAVWILNPKRRRGPALTFCVLLGVLGLLVLVDVAAFFAMDL